MGKNLLKNAICYLSGPIDDCKDHGIGYRKEIRDKIEKAKLNILFLDPTDKFTGFSQEVGEDKENIYKLKKQHKWEELRFFMKKIVHLDLRSVDIVDFLILYIDPDLHMCGSYHETIISLQQKKPILVIVKGGKEKAPDWLFGIIHYSFIFDDVDECVDYLCKLNSGEIPLNDRWVLMRKQLQTQLEKL